MTTPEALRARYARLTDEALFSLLASHNSDGLTSEEFRILTEEIARRSLGKSASAPVIEPPTIPASLPTPNRALPGAYCYAAAPVELRLLAGVIDAAVVLGAYALLSGVIVVLRLRSPELLVRLVSFLGMIPIAYYVLLRDARPLGPSVGKRFADLMVVNLRTGRPCVARDSVTRSLFFVLCYFLPAFAWLIEPLAIVIDRDGQRFGDKAANTQVIEVTTYSTDGRAATSQ